MSNPPLNIDLNPHDLAEVQTILKKTVPDLAVWAFGSRAQWTAKSASDLDLAIISQSPLSLEMSAVLSDAFDESDLPMRVDIVDWASTKDTFRAIINKDKVVLQEVVMSIDTERLESMCELIIDCPHSTPKWTDEGIIVLRNQNIKNGVLNLSSPSYTNEEDYQKRIKRAVPQAGDIVFTREAPIGEVCMIPEGLKCCLGQRQVLLRPKNTINGKYLFWALQSPFTQHQISWSEGTGSTVSNVRIPVLKALNILRHLDQEDKIAEVLSNLDNKIQLNRQTNQTLEQIAQAIFKSWFVDFEPVKAKIAAKHRFNSLSPRERAGVREQDSIEQAALCAIAGKTPEQLQQLDADTRQQLKTTAALFPDALVDSELGEIPEGWGTVRFKQIVEKYIDNRGKTPPIVTSGIPLLEVKHLPENSIKPNLNTTKYVDDETYLSWFRAHLKANDIIISTVGTIGRICMVSENEKLAIAQNLLGLRFDKEKASPYFMFYQMDGFRFRHDVDARLIITVQASIKRKDLETIDLLSPPIDLQNVFEETVKPFVTMLQSNQEIELAELRNTLLPKLLSGELDITKNQQDVTNEAV
jgi:type I restriction enzyme S subunit